MGNMIFIYANGKGLFVGYGEYKILCGKTKKL